MNTNTAQTIKATDVQRECYVCTKKAVAFINISTGRGPATRRPVCTKHNH